jgi:hypothetical protein
MRTSIPDLKCDTTDTTDTPDLKCDTTDKPDLICSASTQAHDDNDCLAHDLQDNEDGVDNGDNGDNGRQQLSVAERGLDIIKQILSTTPTIYVYQIG